MLTVRGLEAGYGPKRVVFGVDLHVNQGEIVGIVGHNGAGKSTTLHSIFGIIRPSKGEVVFCGESAGGRTCRKNVRAGMALARSERFTFSELSVYENLLLGGLYSPADELQERLESVYQLFPILKERTSQPAGQFSGGQQRMLSIGMALMGRPKLILFDEPSLGIAPRLSEQVFETIRRLVDEGGLSVLIVEQNIVQLLQIVDRIYAMRSGRIEHEETVEELRSRDSYWDLF